MSSRTKWWCLAAAIPLAVVGMFPFLLFDAVQRRSHWAQVLVYGTAFRILSWPSMFIGGVFFRIGWANGLVPYITLWLLTIAFWFALSFGLTAFARYVRRARAHI
jgi:hypothetical protein